MNTVTINPSSDDRFIRLERQLKQYRLHLRKQQKWIKYVEEWLLHKFGFDVQLRIKLNTDSSKEDVDVDDSEDDGEETEQDERVQQQVNRNNQWDGINVISYNQSLKRKRIRSNDLTPSAGLHGSKPVDIDTRVYKVTTQTSNSLRIDKIDDITVPVKMEEEEQSFVQEQDSYNTTQSYLNSNVISKGVSTTMTTKTGHVVHVVHDEDQDVDIKYNLFTQLELATGDKSSCSLPVPVSNEEAARIREESGSSSDHTPFETPKTSLSPVSPFEKLIKKLNYAATPFNFLWILQMRQYQPRVMPYSMFIKRDDVRQWFQYLPNLEEPEKARYRCRLCYKYVREWGYPRKYWGPMETNDGQLKKNDSDNRNAINLHVTKQSHKEICYRLTNEKISFIGPNIILSKIVKKQLLDSLET